MYQEPSVFKTFIFLCRNEEEIKEVNEFCSDLDNSLKLSVDPKESLEEAFEKQRANKSIIVHPIPISIRKNSSLNISIRQYLLHDIVFFHVLIDSDKKELDNPISIWKEQLEILEKIDCLDSLYGEFTVLNAITEDFKDAENLLDMLTNEIPEFERILGGLDKTEHWRIYLLNDGKYLHLFNEKSKKDRFRYLQTEFTVDNISILKIEKSYKVFKDFFYVCKESIYRDPINEVEKYLVYFPRFKNAMEINYTKNFKNREERIYSKYRQNFEKYIKGIDIDKGIIEEEIEIKKKN
ncbi:MAG: hypothetical protein ACE5J3_11760 [Methanosarcinales archaeon]